MAKRSMLLALTCWCLSEALALAQFGLPDAGKSFPGPMDSWHAPPGPSDDLSLPADLPNAWDPPKPPCLECFTSGGAMALMRQRMGHGPVAIAGGNTVFELDDIRTNFNLGVRAAVGVLCGDQGIEVSGFFIPAHDSAFETSTAGLATVFSNAAVLSNPDFFRATLTTEMGNYEVNYRCWSSIWHGPELIIGCRFMDQEERLTFQGTGAGGSETYIARAENRIVGPTVGVEYGIPIGCSTAFTLGAKGTWGWNMVHSEASLETNGVLAASSADNRSIFSHIYEIGAYADFWIADPMHLRLGCQAIWLLHVADVSDQVNFDATGPANANNQGSIMYWGPMAELQFVW